MVRRLIAPDERWRVKAAILPLLIGAHLTGTQRRLLGQFVDIYLQLGDREERAFQAERASLSVPEREAVMEIVTNWELKGRAEGQRLILERQLTRKLGVLPDDVIARLPQLSSSQLTALGEVLLDFTTVSDLERWLASPPPPVNEDDDEGEEQDEDDQADEE